ncbi:transcription factor A, mitochondrial-like [Lingula anatina]|uniref:Transcription factor A, mitochondrial-like n=1 Tax=Lingula anatina TaxID=7574 RepID=A0A1S3JX96_LINAN|nr:transcription factor A, mitochondrial-like [Lingula anatina]|eukprot:XP_013414998.1 transcription factor A, mitochondrial-like [Lingula anatina]
MALRVLKLSFGKLRLFESSSVCYARSIHYTPVACASQEKIVPPKKPPSSFLSFLNAKRSDIKNENPDIKNTELSKIAGAMWKSLNTDEKAMYVNAAKKELDKYHEKYEAFIQSLSPEQREMLGEQGRTRKQKLERRRTKAMLHKLEKPKKPVSAFLRFAASKMVDRGEAPVTQYMSGCAQMWRRMPEDDKQEFKKAYAEEKAEYEKNLAAWEQKVSAEGHPELVRGYSQQLKKERNAAIIAKKREKMALTRAKKLAKAAAAKAKKKEKLAQQRIRKKEKAAAQKKKQRKRAVTRVKKLQKITQDEP